MVQYQLKVRAWDWVYTFHPIYLKADRGSLVSETSLVYLESSRLARAKTNETTTTKKQNKLQDTTAATTKNCDSLQSEFSHCIGDLAKQKQKQNIRQGLLLQVNNM